MAEVSAATTPPPSTTSDLVLPDASPFMSGGKVIIFFKPVGAALQLKQSKFKLKATVTFQSVIAFLRKQLKSQPGDSLFLFINRSFQPTPEAVVSDLFKCFHDKEKLVVYYSTTPAWG
eukprot:TRINITY_DN701_c3_g1_i1.p1 TRINITY_DN701_c3_g1~~TRINITY_DN701_c3_g1_i1.p1  ORF type:complete len:126 (+),score=26.77 TRINITY_DN701_c3_g1_i1:25-378(+)